MCIFFQLFCIFVFAYFAILCIWKWKCLYEGGVAHDFSFSIFVCISKILCIFCILNIWIMKQHVLLHSCISSIFWNMNLYNAAYYLYYAYFEVYNSWIWFELSDEDKDDHSSCPLEKDDHRLNFANRIIQVVGTGGFNPLDIPSNTLQTISKVVFVAICPQKLQKIHHQEMLFIRQPENSSDIISGFTYFARIFCKCYINYHNSSCTTYSLQFCLLVLQLGSGWMSSDPTSYVSTVNLIKFCESSQICSWASCHMCQWAKRGRYPQPVSGFDMRRESE